MQRYRMLIFIVLIFCLIFTGCQFSDNDTAPPSQDQSEIPVDRPPVLVDQQTTLATVYYTTTDRKWLVPLTIPINSTREVARVAVEKLLSGAPNDFVATAIPAETKLRYLYSSGNTIYIDLTKDFLDIEPEYANMALESLRATVLSLAEGYSLQLLIDGERCDSLAGINISEPFATSYVNPTSENTQGIPLVYYFSDQQAMYLVPQTLVISTNTVNEAKDATQFLAKTIVEALLLGPAETSGLSRTIWPGTELLNISVKDGVATVDLSAQVLGYGGGSAAEQMLISSLLHSLTSLNGVTSVQLLIDGEKQEYLPEGSDISQPLTIEAPLNLIG